MVFAGLQNHMRARDVLGVQPDGRFVCCFSVSVHHFGVVVPSHQDACVLSDAVNSMGGRHWRFLSCAAAAGVITLFRQFCPELTQVVFRLARLSASSTLSRYAAFPALGDPFRQDLSAVQAFLHAW